MFQVGGTVLAEVRGHWPWPQEGGQLGLGYLWPAGCAVFRPAAGSDCMPRVTAWALCPPIRLTRLLSLWGGGSAVPAASPAVGARVWLLSSCVPAVWDTRLVTVLCVLSGPFPKLAGLSRPHPLPTCSCEPRSALRSRTSWAVGGRDMQLHPTWWQVFPGLQSWVGSCVV